MNETIPKLAPGAFLDEATERVILDVRSPGEYAKGHIPGAHSFPLFTDEERARVGTLYTKSGREAAFYVGLDLVGPKMSGFVKQAKRLAPHQRLLIHCWRGGMRSGSMAWLLQSAGFDVKLLEGGYKSYRAHIREAFRSPARLLVLSGMTGCGKTEILHHLEALDSQVLDLEGLAHHRGSAFGHVGQPPQPTTEQYENDLAARWRQFDFSQPIWLEDESRNVGSVQVPEPLYAAMTRGTIVRIDFSREYRIDRLVKEYGGIDDRAVALSLLKIKDSLGNKRVQELVELLSNREYASFAEMILNYYDESYAYSLKRKANSRIEPFIPSTLHPEDQAVEILDFANKLYFDVV